MIPSSSDVANLTAVDQFGIGMRLETFNGSGTKLEEVGSANSDTVFDAMQKIPGGPAATLRDGSGDVLRVLSPNQTGAYPELDRYVRAMNGTTVTLNTAFYGTPFTTSHYPGTFQADGSIVLSGLLAGFSTGLWGGKYGNDSLSFCTDPMTTVQGSWCPNGFNQPAFGDARKSLSSYPTCEQYAAVINEYLDAHGNPYSDASKKVTVSLDQPGTGGQVETLQLTVLPDSGSAGPVAGGNSNCGAAGRTPSGPRKSSVKKVSFYKKAVLKGKSAKVGTVNCSAACGHIKVVAKKGKKQVGYRKYRATGKNAPLTMNVTKAGRKIFKKQKKMKVKVQLWITPAGGEKVTRKHKLKFLKRG